MREKESSRAGRRRFLGAAVGAGAASLLTPKAAGAQATDALQRPGRSRGLFSDDRLYESLRFLPADEAAGARLTSGDERTAKPVRMGADQRPYYAVNEQRQIQNEDELGDQFFVYQIARGEGAVPERVLMDPLSVTPALTGEEVDKRDVLVEVSLLSFHLGALPRSYEKATLKLALAKDQASSDRYFDIAYWTITAGLELFNNKGEPPDPKEYQYSSKESFGRRPVEIAGGLGKIQFHLVRHRGLTWWKRIFNLFLSAPGQALLSVFGFPALAQNAIQMVDRVLEEIQGDVDVLFRSRFLTLAFTQKAKSDFEQNNGLVKVGSLSPGYWLFVPGRYVEKINTELDNLVYNHTLGQLVQSDKPYGHDPLPDVPYLVLGAKMVATKLDHDFSMPTEVAVNRGQPANPTLSPQTS